MKVVLFAPYFPPATLGGGPIRTLSALARTAPPTVDLSIITRDRDLGEDVPLPVERNVWLPSPGANPRIRYTSFDQTSAVARALWSSRRGVDVVYVNSFFDRKLSIFPVFLHRLGFWRKSQLLIAPRGEFSAGALALKRARKQVFIRMFKILSPRRLLWQASTGDEARDIRAVFGQDAKVVVREDETDLPVVPMAHAERPPQDEHTLRVVFISRLSPMKGLPVLLDAIALLTVPVILDIYGPEEDPSVVAAANRAIRDMPANVTCTLRGPVDADDVPRTFASYDLFAFPTAGENFGHVIAEALSAGCPVMLSDTTPWSQTIRDGGGILIDSRDPRDWGKALNTFAKLGSNEWTAASTAASNAYNRWATAPKGPHIFDLLPSATLN